MKVWGAAIPYAEDRNLGREYNAEMAALTGPDDWRIFVDHDALVGLSRDWFRLVVDAIAAVPDAGAIVAMTNRIDAFWQRVPDVDRENHDIEYHTRIALARQATRSLLDITHTKGFGGVAFAVSKAAWSQTPGFADGMLCVDHSIHFALRKVGRRIYLHEGWYVYHRRRATVGPLPADTPRVADCPCRGAEMAPARRVIYPERRPV